MRSIGFLTSIKAELRLRGFNRIAPCNPHRRGTERTLKGLQQWRLGSQEIVAKNVAAVLALLAFEKMFCIDLPIIKGVAQKKKLADVLTGIKDSNIFQGVLSWDSAILS